MPRHRPLDDPPSRLRQHQLQDFLFEFKYLDLKESNLSDEQLLKKSGEELLALPSVKTKLKGARERLAVYRRPLEQKYGELLRLKVFSVVAIGFERLV